MSRLPCGILVAGTITLAFVSALSAANLGTTFTYQGQLKQNSLPLTGPADMVFTLWSAPTAGAQVGPTLSFDGSSGNPPSVTVTNGLFKVDLDFGSGVFNGNERYLQIQTRVPPGGGGYTTLAPRQHLTATPNALYAVNGGGWLQGSNTITNVSGSFVGINRTSQVSPAEYFGIQCPVNNGYGGMYVQTTGAAGQPFYGYTNGASAFAWHYLDGTTGNWLLTNNNYTCLTATNTGQIGIGTSSPSAPLEVDGGSSAIIARADPNTGYAISAYGANGIYASSNGAGGGAAVYGACTTANGYGIQGYNGAANGIGILSNASTGIAVYGQTSTGTGIYGTNGGSNTTGYAGYFQGRVTVAGTLTKSGGSFKIDHPLDPANKFLSHSFVESPDMKNIYDGVATLDGKGEATVGLPDWFEALNRDFRYQLTCIGGYAPVYIAQKVKNNQFRIAGGKEGLEVSWQVTGIRQDKWAEANRIPVEEAKSGAEKGHYIHPELYGAANDLALDAAARQTDRARVMKEPVKATQAK